jgi:hypothetical protein
VGNPLINVGIINSIKRLHFVNYCSYFVKFKVGNKKNYYTKNKRGAKINIFET